MTLIKYKYIVALFIVAIVIWFYASLQKIMHAPNADLLFKISFVLILISAVFALIKLLFTKNNNSKE
jgi:hypothetical protein